MSNMTFPAFLETEKISGSVRMIWSRSTFGKQHQQPRVFAGNSDGSWSCGDTGYLQFQNGQRFGGVRYWYSLSG